MIAIRPERAGDEAAIDALLEQAFGGRAEADLVARLRADGDLVLSLVAEAEELVGHVAFSPMNVEGAPDVKALGLAPLAIAADARRQGFGAALVETALMQIEASGADIVFVLGDPAYYGRFGFSRAAAAGFTSPYDGPAFQALAFRAVAPARVSYAPAFAALG